MAPFIGVDLVLRCDGRRVVGACDPSTRDLQQASGSVRYGQINELAARKGKAAAAGRAGRFNLGDPDTKSSIRHGVEIRFTPCRLGGIYLDPGGIVEDGPGRLSPL